MSLLDSLSADQLFALGAALGSAGTVLVVWLWRRDIAERWLDSLTRGDR